MNSETKDKFVAILSGVNRPGIAELISYLENDTDFFTAPASTQYHGAVEGGLLEHSLAVYRQMMTVMETWFDAYDAETVAIVALLHDLCKTNFYTVKTRNVKNETTGRWEQVPFYSIDDKLPLGHGEKSLWIANQFIKLSIEEAMAIRWHMGGYDDARGSYGSSQTLSTAQAKYELITALHIADLAAGYFEGK